MACDVEAIWAALFERVSSVQGFRIYSRRRYDPGIDSLPALFVLDDNGDETTNDNGPRPILTMTGEVWVIAKTQETDKEPTKQLNVLVKAVREALERQPTDPLGTGEFYGGGHVQHYTNLGGLVRTLRAGRVEKGDGSLTGQAVAKFTIEMEALG